MNFKEYLGDGVYADWDRYNIILTSNNGEETLDIILLEPPVVESLLKYIRKYYNLKEFIK